jgi:ketosteroid isomerase-like protein
MSNENVEIVRQFYADPRNPAEAAHLFTPDAEIDFSAVYPDMGIVRGFSEMLKYRDTGPWREMSLVPERFFDVDHERVLVFVRVEARGRESGVPIVQRTAHEFTVSDAMIVRMKIYLERSAALEAAGLSEQEVHTEGS